MHKSINIIALIGLLLTTMSLSVNAQSEVDPIYERTNEALNLYQESGDIDILFAIGYSLPEGIYITNSSRTGHLDYDLIRPPRTELYIRWISELLLLGRKINYSPLSYDPNDPRNLCQDTNSAIFVDPPPGYLEQVELYKKNCRIKNYHTRYFSTMELFNCFYKRAFSKQGKKRADLLAIAQAWCEKNIDDPTLQADILEIVRREVRSRKCPR
ncbi:hypothetical protein [Lewinella sp. LCG006]|uniref:hypothetical protein n=1 Tax=Lewinella sp. LCG006 TaxID=3231911 RepID=UPI00345F6ECF